MSRTKNIWNKNRKIKLKNSPRGKNGKWEGKDKQKIHLGDLASTKINCTKERMENEDEGIVKEIM